MRCLFAQHLPVSILVLLEIGLGGNIVYCSHIIVFVSILVLLEIGLGVEAGTPVQVD